MKEFSKEEIIEKVNTGKLNRYSDYTIRMLAQGILKKIHYKDGTSVLDINTSAPYYSSVLNAKNLIAIGNTIYKYEEGVIKMITNGDFSLIERLENVTEDETNITIAKMTPEKQNKKATVEKELDKAQDQEGYRKVVGRLAAQRYTIGCTTGTLYYLQVWCERKHWLNGWQRDKMTVSVNGHYTKRQFNESKTKVTSQKIEKKYSPVHIASRTYMFVSEREGKNTDCRPIDVINGYWKVKATGGGVELSLTLRNHSTFGI